MTFVYDVIVAIHKTNKPSRSSGHETACTSYARLQRATERDARLGVRGHGTGDRRCLAQTLVNNACYRPGEAINRNRSSRAGRTIEWNRVKCCALVAVSSRGVGCTLRGVDTEEMANIFAVEVTTYRHRRQRPCLRY